MPPIVTAIIALIAGAIGAFFMANWTRPATYHAQAIQPAPQPPQPRYIPVPVPQPYAVPERRYVPVPRYATVPRPRACVPCDYGFYHVGTPEQPCLCGRYRYRG